MTHGAHSDAASHPNVGHVVPLRLLFGVLAVLLVLTFITVAVTWVDLGGLNLAVALFIATIKAALVLLYFMHLRWDRPFNAVVIIAALALVMVFVLFAMLDSNQYHEDVIPGYAPLIQR